MEWSVQEFWRTKFRQHFFCDTSNWSTAECCDGTQTSTICFPRPTSDMVHWPYVRQPIQLLPSSLGAHSLTFFFCRSRALREMQLMVQSQQVDLIIETRDARMPLTSINPAFERILHLTGGGARGSTKRLIVYNKADLAQDCFQEVSREWK